MARPRRSRAAPHERPRYGELLGRGEPGRGALGVGATGTQGRTGTLPGDAPPHPGLLCVCVGVPFTHQEIAEIDRGERQARHGRRRGQGGALRLRVGPGSRRPGRQLNAADGIGRRRSTDQGTRRRGGLATCDCAERAPCIALRLHPGRLVKGRTPVPDSGSGAGGPERRKQKPTNTAWTAPVSAANQAVKRRSRYVPRSRWLAAPFASLRQRPEASGPGTLLTSYHC